MLRGAQGQKRRWAVGQKVSQVVSFFSFLMGVPGGFSFFYGPDFCSMIFVWAFFDPSPACSFSLLGGKREQRFGVFGPAILVNGLSFRISKDRLGKDEGRS